MSTLLIFLPPPHKDHPSQRGEAAPLPATDYAFMLSADEQHVTQRGRAAPQDLPSAQQCVLVLPDGALSWLRVQLPKVPKARLRAALEGALEEQLLTPSEQLHMAVAAEPDAAHPSWVAVCLKAYLQQHLAAFEQAHVHVQRAIALAWPETPGTGHFHTAPGHTAPTLSWASPEGVVELPLNPGSRALISDELVQTCQWSAEPESVAQAEAWLGRNVLSLVAADRALRALRDGANLLQFDLTPRTQGLQQIQQWLRDFRQPAWRPTRWALAGLVAVQLLGLNLYAWQQNRLLQERKTTRDALLTQTFPQVKVVLDGPVQMQKELALLRQRTGQLSQADFEQQLAALANAWPPGQAAPQGLDYQTGKLTAQTPALGPQDIESIRQLLSPSGWHLEAEAGRLTLSPNTAP
ncbi:type II secretion system protein GspL [Roseateles sp. BYS180W]|uniref:Type II secretion system protein GspL n=1 Tax=Roseateles rivi TaxID=3299028 RepID=A0ABW7FRA8_9BURK